MPNVFFTSESVTEGHPDKVCDQISDAVLDAILINDSSARVACETLCTTGLIMIVGEISTRTYVDIPKIARSVISEIGYLGKGFGADTCAVITSIDEQSPDIALGVDTAIEAKSGSVDSHDSVGAGDQGMMFGFACKETKELMPMPISLAHKLAAKLSLVRKESILPYLGPDGKTQVTVEYSEDGKPVRIDAIVVSSQHSEDIDLEIVRNDIISEVINSTIPSALIDSKTKIYVNPTGRFVIGGPQGDSGLTGRKIIVDTYGGYSRHGGGAFSGKDPTKVDRSAAYMARYVAKNIVAAELAEKCEIGLSYAIGIAHPVSVMVETFGTGKIPEELISQAVRSVFDLRPMAIINTLNLCNPIYRQLAAYGHMGREDLNVTWERIDKVESIIKAIGGDGYSG